MYTSGTIVTTETPKSTVPAFTTVPGGGETEFTTTSNSNSTETYQGIIDMNSNLRTEKSN